ncbi:uncharacterized protein LAJ45_07622 [Morchella importuna]|uniref:uncharacterized protein n=1 Tax=Morchella importuna TaxID=1174673 RepID=UPI001E8E0DD9|nr:uncharacterized protein LAJ45_07622 [Morchella importuna]KAH8148519.1 hypothetical protein LAJ45_07622 [Morchella importuna]
MHPNTIISLPGARSSRTNKYSSGELVYHAFNAGREPKGLNDPKEHSSNASPGHQDHDHIYTFDQARNALLLEALLWNEAVPVVENRLLYTRVCSGMRESAPSH